MERFLHSKLYRILYLLLTAISCITSSRIALTTRFNTHPDEFIHADAFCYFEKHWWPPGLNSDEVSYEPSGWSRVYNGEIVYLVYGRISRLIEPLEEVVLGTSETRQQVSRSGAYRVLLPVVWGWPKCEFRHETYRLLNTVLLLVTLLVLFWSGSRHIWATVIAAVLVCVPQVIYVYSYANSDAWGLSWSLFLFVFAATHRQPFSSYKNTVVLGVLTSIVLLSKQPYWLSLPFSYLLIGWHTIRHEDHSEVARPRILATRLILLGVLVVFIIAPLKIAYPLSQGDFAARVEQMREERAREDFKPSSLASPGYRLASKGVRLEQVYMNPQWLELSTKSLYGLFGYFTLRLPNWIYITSGAVALLCVLLTIAMMVVRWKILPGSRKLLLMFAPTAIALCIAASLYNSWTQDFQPQGRYLFPALVPIALLLAGTIDLEPRWMRTLRIGAWLFSYLLCLYVLWGIVLSSPLFKG